MSLKYFTYNYIVYTICLIFFNLTNVNGEKGKK